MGLVGTTGTALMIQMANRSEKLAEIESRPTRGGLFTARKPPYPRRDLRESPTFADQEDRICGSTRVAAQISWHSTFLLKFLLPGTFPATFDDTIVGRVDAGMGFPRLLSSLDR